MSRPFQMPPVLKGKPTPEVPAGLSSTDGAAQPTPAKRRPWWMMLPYLLTIGVLAGLVILLFAIREPTETLTRAALDAAQDRWRQASVTDYDMEVTTTATDWVSAQRLSVRVRGGRVVDIRTDTNAQIADPSAWSIDGWFDVLERELDMTEAGADSPTAGAGKTFLRVRFNERLGYPELFIRVIGGTNRSMETRVERFEVIKSS